MSHTILAVDDSPIVRKMMQRTLSDGGYEVALAEDGVLALERFKQGGIDLVITDVNMPNMDGLQLIREIRKINEHVPILTLTTETEDSLKREGQAGGADGWIVKPPNERIILDKISGLLSRSSEPLI